MTSYESHAPQTVAKQVRTRQVWDVALSIVLLILGAGAFLIGAVFATFSIAFIDNCPEPCHEDLAIQVQVICGVVLAIVALLGTITTIVLIVVRRRAWWVAATTLLLVIVGWIVAFILYSVSFSA